MPAFFPLLLEDEKRGGEGAGVRQRGARWRGRGSGGDYGRVYVTGGGGEDRWE